MASWCLLVPILTPVLCTTQFSWFLLSVHLSHLDSLTVRHCASKETCQVNPGPCDPGTESWCFVKDETMHWQVLPLGCAYHTTLSNTHTPSPITPSCKPVHGSISSDLGRLDTVEDVHFKFLLKRRQLPLPATTAMPLGLISVHTPSDAILTWRATTSSLVPITHHQVHLDAISCNMQMARADKCFASAAAMRIMT
jgi:hypothetical protein